MKKLALAAAIAALSANASAGFVAVKTTTGSNVESFLWDIEGSLLDGSTFSVALPTQLSTAIAGADSVVWDAFDFVYDQSPTVTTDVRGVATNPSGAATTLQTGLQLDNTIVALANFTTTIDQPAFVYGVAGPSVAGDSGFYNAANHGESLSGGAVGVLGFNATAALGETVALWEAAKASGQKSTTGRGASKVVGTDELPAGSMDTGLTATLTADGFAVAPVPVPAAVWLMGSALAGLGVVRRRSA